MINAIHELFICRYPFTHQVPDWYYVRPQVSLNVNEGKLKQRRYDTWIADMDLNIRIPDADDIINTIDDIITVDLSTTDITNLSSKVMRMTNNIVYAGISVPWKFRSSPVALKTT